MKILIGINNLTTVSQLAYANHCQFWYRLGREFKNEHEFALCNPRRLSIDKMRNFAAKAALEHDFDRLVFIDDDVLLPLDTIKMLLEADKDICAGVTLIRGYPYHPMIFDFYSPLIAGDGRIHFVDNYAEKADKVTGLLQCDAVGFSCCMIKTELLRKMEKPYFITGERHTEDVYFCARAKKEFPETSIFVDTRIKTAHILGDDIIEPDNLGPRLMFDEMMNPGVAERSKKQELSTPLINPKVLRKGDYVLHVKEEVFGA